MLVDVSRLLELWQPMVQGIVGALAQGNGATSQAALTER